MKKHNNFNVAILQEQSGKTLECSIDERYIIDFVESTIRGKMGCKRGQGGEFEIHFNPFCASVLLWFFVQR